MSWILPTMKIEETLLAGWFIVLATVAHVQLHGNIPIAGTWFTYAIITLTGYHIFEYMVKLWLKFKHYGGYPLQNIRWRQTGLYYSLVQRFSVIFSLEPHSQPHHHHVPHRDREHHCLPQFQGLQVTAPTHVCNCCLRSLAMGLLLSPLTMAFPMSLTLDLPLRRLGASKALSLHVIGC